MWPQELDLSGNPSLSIPLGVLTMLSPMSNLRRADLSGASITGSMAATLSRSISTLQELNLGGPGCRLTGTMPDQWSVLTNLVKLNMNQCGLRGALPAAWSGMRKVWAGGGVRGRGGVQEPWLQPGRGQRAQGWDGRGGTGWLPSPVD